jgi:hypothetical protein
MFSYRDRLLEAEVAKLLEEDRNRGEAGAICAEEWLAALNHKVVWYAQCTCGWCRGLCGNSASSIQPRLLVIYLLVLPDAQDHRANSRL